MGGQTPLTSVQFAATSRVCLQQRHIRHRLLYTSSPSPTKAATWGGPQAPDGRPSNETRLFLRQRPPNQPPPPPHFTNQPPPLYQLNPHFTTQLQQRAAHENTIFAPSIANKFPSRKHVGSSLSLSLSLSPPPPPPLMGGGWM